VEAANSGISGPAAFNVVFFPRFGPHRARVGCGRSHLHIVSQRWQATYCDLRNRRTTWTAFLPHVFYLIFVQATGPPSCTPHILQYLDSTDTAALKGSENMHRESCRGLSCLFSLCCCNLSSYWKMPQRFRKFKLQPSNAFSNMVPALRYTPGGLKRMLLK